MRKRASSTFGMPSSKLMILMGAGFRDMAFSLGRNEERSQFTADLRGCTRIKTFNHRGHKGTLRKSQEPGSQHSPWKTKWLREEEFQENSLKSHCERHILGMLSTLRSSRKRNSRAAQHDRSERDWSNRA